MLHLISQTKIEIANLPLSDEVKTEYALKKKTFKDYVKDVTGWEVHTAHEYLVFAFTLPQAIVDDLLNFDCVHINFLASEEESSGVMSGSIRQFISLINSCCCQEASTATRKFGNILYAYLQSKCAASIPGTKRTIKDDTFILI